MEQCFNEGASESRDTSQNKNGTQTVLIQGPLFTYSAALPWSLPGEFAGATYW